MPIKCETDDMIYPNGVCKETYSNWIELNGIGYAKQFFEHLAKYYEADLAKAEQYIFCLPGGKDNDAFAWSWIRNELFMPFSPKRVLDIGCNTGNHAIAMARKLKHEGISVVGIDMSMVLVGIAKGLQCKFGIDNAEFIQADALNMPFKEKEFDLCITKHVLEHLPSIYKALKEQDRVSKIVTGIAPINDGANNTEHIFNLDEDKIKDVLNRIFKHWKVQVFPKSEYQNLDIMAYGGWND